MSEARAGIAGTLERVGAACDGLGQRELATRDGLPCFEVPPEVLLEFMRRLRDRCGFESVTLVTAIDRTPRRPRFDVVHQLLSVQHADRVRVVTSVDEQVPSIAALWPGADFSERECYDMFGIVFTGHPDLRRLLMPEGYAHHPLRKDFPHRGIEPDRLYRQWERSRRAPEER